LERIVENFDHNIDLWHDHEFDIKWSLQFQELPKPDSTTLALYKFTTDSPVLFFLLLHVNTLAYYKATVVVESEVVLGLAPGIA
jgi:hypothetical protein